MGIELFSSDSSDIAHEMAAWEQDGIARCCECGELFSISELQGSFMARACPTCGNRLHEGAYDAHARTVAWKLRRTRRGSDEAKALANELEWLALARYLTSEWYLLSGTPTSAVGYNATQEGYSFIPAYDKFGRFFLRENYGESEVHGIQGELALFDSLRLRVNDRNSPLYGSKIIPSLELVTDEVDSRGKLHISRNQTDCVLLTRQGAFVFEVKKWHASIHADAKRCRIEVKRNGAIWEYRRSEGPIGQVVASRKALLKHCRKLHADRLCSIVVFVDPIEMTGDVGSLPCGKNVYFGWVKTGGKSSVRKEIEDCVRGWEEHPGSYVHGSRGGLAARLLSEYSCHELPINPLGRM